MPRSILSDPAFADEPFTEREAFLDLVAAAAWKPRQMRLRRGLVHLKRGQLLASSRYLAERWKWPEPRARRFVARISGRRANDAQGDAPIDAHSDSLIDAHPTAEGTIITIRNYDDFQKPQKEETTSADAHSDAPSDASDDAPLDPKTTQREEEINNKSLLKERGRARATRIAKDWKPSDETWAWAVELIGEPAAEKSLERFLLQRSQLPDDRGGLSTDWDANWRKWVLDDADRHGARSSVGGSGGAITDTGWNQVLGHFAATGQWTKYVAEFGPDPSSPACRAPRHLLQQHGLAGEAAA